MANSPSVSILYFINQGTVMLSDYSPRVGPFVPTSVAPMADTDARPSRSRPNPNATATPSTDAGPSTSNPNATQSTSTVSTSLVNNDVRSPRTSTPASPAPSASSAEGNMDAGNNNDDANGGLNNDENGDVREERVRNESSDRNEDSDRNESSDRNENNDRNKDSDRRIEERNGENNDPRASVQQVVVRIPRFPRVQLSKKKNDYYFQCKKHHVHRVQSKHIRANIRSNRRISRMHVDKPTGRRLFLYGKEIGTASRYNPQEVDRGQMINVHDKTCPDNYKKSERRE